LCLWRASQRLWRASRLAHSCNERHTWCDERHTIPTFLAPGTRWTYLHAWLFFKVMAIFTEDVLKTVTEGTNINSYFQNLQRTRFFFQISAVSNFLFLSSLGIPFTYYFCNFYYFLLAILFSSLALN
jgi:hypothetical protein